MFRLTHMSLTGSKLKSLRSARGLTQRELATLSQVNLRTIRTIEDGGRKPEPWTIRKLAEALNVSSADLLDDQ